MPQREHRITLATPRLATLDEKGRRFDAVANQSTIVDCYQSVIENAAWNQGNDLDEFRANPVGLWMHNMAMCSAPVPPVFSPQDLRVEENVGLVFTPTWQEAGIDPFADMLFNKYTKEPRLLRAFSVGFMPLEWVDNDQKETGLPYKRRYTRVKLQEISAVDIPGNRGSLARNQLGYLQLDGALVRAICSLGFERVPFTDEFETPPEPSIDELMLQLDRVTTQLSKVSRSDLAKEEVRTVTTVFRRLAGFIPEVSLGDDADEREALVMGQAVETIQRLRGVAEQAVGLALEATLSRMGERA